MNKGYRTGDLQRRGQRREYARNLGGDVDSREEEREIDDFEYEFNEIVINQLGDLDPRYAVDIETIKEILLLEQQGTPARVWTKLLRSKKVRHPEAYEAYREALDLDGED